MLRVKLISCDDGYRVYWLDGHDRWRPFKKAGMPDFRHYIGNDDMVWENLEAVQNFLTQRYGTAFKIVATESRS